MRAMLPRRDASVFLRAPIMRIVPEVGANFALRGEPKAGSFVHDMF
jgi:hypothetical protein